MMPGAVELHVAGRWSAKLMESVIFVQKGLPSAAWSVKVKSPFRDHVPIHSPLRIVERRLTGHDRSLTRAIDLRFKCEHQIRRCWTVMGAELN